MGNDTEYQMNKRPVAAEAEHYLTQTNETLLYEGTGVFTQKICRDLQSTDC